MSSTKIAEPAKEKTEIALDVLSGNQPPNVAVLLSYNHPIFSHVPPDRFWCGAHPDEDVYENPYNADQFSWEVDLNDWNSFQSDCKNMSPEERSELWAIRARDIEQQKLKFLEINEVRKRYRK